MDILSYLHSTRSQRIRYTPTPNVPSCLHRRTAEIAGNAHFHTFSDSSWGTTRPSFGYVCFYSGGPVSYCAKNAKSAHSSCEAEYSAAAAACRDVIFIRSVCDDLGWPLHGRLVLAVDNTAAINVATNLGVTSRNKHFDRETHFIREQVELRRIVLQHISTVKQVADVFTKDLDKTTFLRHEQQLMSNVQNY